MTDCGTIKPGDICRTTDVCDLGTICLPNGNVMRCIAPAGGACSTDSYCDTLAGYYCTGGECAIPATIVPAGGACSADSNCDAVIGYSCINGRCVIDAGGV